MLFGRCHFVLIVRICASFNLFRRFPHLHIQLSQNAGLLSVHAPKNLGAGIS